MINNYVFMPIIGKITGESLINFNMILEHAIIGAMKNSLKITLMAAKMKGNVKNVMDGKSRTIILDCIKLDYVTLKIVNKN